MSELTEKRSAATGGGVKRMLGENPRAIAAMVLAVVATLFATFNLDEVRVNWVLGTWSTPLIIVIAVSFALGAASDRLFVHRRARRRTKAAKAEQG